VTKEQIAKKVPYIEPGTGITPADIEAWEKFAHVKIASGDALFLRTGGSARRAKRKQWEFIGGSAAGSRRNRFPDQPNRDVPSRRCLTVAFTAA